MVMGSPQAINMLTASCWPVKEQVRTPARSSSENLSRIVSRLSVTEAGEGRTSKLLAKVLDTLFVYSCSSRKFLKTCYILALTIIL